MSIRDFFTKQSEPLPAPDPPDVDRGQRRYDANLLDLHAADLALADAHQKLAHHHAVNKETRFATVNGEIFNRLGAMTADAELQQLESRRDRCMEKRNALLEEHARLKMALGLTR